MGDNTDLLRKLEVAKRCTIPELNPELPEPATKSVQGVITITWPFSAVNNTFAFILAEPDFRLRRNKGQVRVNLRGAAAKAVGASGLGSNDEVLLSLDGVVWEPEVVKKRQSLPGAGLEWQISFPKNISLSVKSNETGETTFVSTQSAADDISVDHPPIEDPSVDLMSGSKTSLDVPLRDEFSLPSVAIATPAKHARITSLDQGEFASPAFIKRARVSYGGLFEDGFDFFDESTETKPRGRKRRRFGRESGAWRYSSRSVSPKSSSSTSEKGTSPKAPEPTSSLEPKSPRPQMADEGCQTMELDIPLSLPAEVGAYLPTDQTQDAYTGRQDIDPERKDRVDTGVQAQFFPANAWQTVDAVSGSVFGASNPFSMTGTPNPIQPENHEFAAPSFNTWDNNENPFGVATPNSSDLLQPIASFPSHPLGAQLPLNDAELPTDPLSGNKASSLAQSDDQTRRLTAQHPGGQAELSVEASHSNVNYPPLEVMDQMEVQPDHVEGPSHYPSSYLDERQTSPNADDTDKHRPHQDSHTTTDAYQSSWATVNKATVNNPVEATSIPQSGQLASSNGSSPDQALVIGESDSESEAGEDLPPAPTAFNDTVDGGRASGSEMYEDADAEDEVDAQYSDGDEPEYEGDEMGGDYDARNYEAPDDDEDDSHDEDLQQHSRQPEFDGGESWDDEDEEGYDEEGYDEDMNEYESESELDHEQPASQTSRPAQTSVPTVIDLISSSEVEEEEESEKDANEEEMRVDSSPPRPLVTQQPRRSKSPNDDLPIDENSADDQNPVLSSGAQPPSGPLGEEPGQSSEEQRSDLPNDPQRDGTGDQTTSMFHRNRKALDDPSEERESCQPSTSHDHEMTEVQIVDPVPSDELLQPNRPDAGENQMIAYVEEENAAVALDSNTAADGLEMLSKAVDNESNANKQAILVETSTEHTNMEMTHEISDERNVTMQEHTQMYSDQPQLHREGDSRSSEPEEHVDLVQAPLVTDAEKIPAGLDHSGGNALVVPTSPPMTQSFLSQRIDDEVEEVSRETAVTIEENLPDQLPTPLDIEVTVAAQPETAVIDSQMHVDDAGQAIVPTESAIPEHQSLDDSRQQLYGPDLPTVSDDNMECVSREQESFTAQEPPLIEDRSEEPLLNEVRGHSPNLGFHRQVNMTSQTGLNESSQALREDNEVQHSSVTASFRSQMEIDDELQASIMEYSQSEQLDQITKDSTEPVQAEPESRKQTSDDTTYFNSGGETQNTAASLILGASSIVSGSSDPAQVLKDGALDGDSDMESVETPDPSAQLARGVYSPRLPSNPRSPTLENKGHESFLLDAQRSSSPNLDDPSSQLARESFDRFTATEEVKSSVVQQPQREVHTSPSPGIGDGGGVQVARASTAKTSSDQNQDGSKLHRPVTRSFDARHSSPLADKNVTSGTSVHMVSSETQGLPSVKTDEQTSHVARARALQAEDDGDSLTAAKMKLVRHLNKKLPDCTSLKVLRQHLTKSVDVMAIVMMQPPEPRRAKGGPREYMMSFTVTDHSIGPRGVAEVQLYRPHKDSLPVVRPGDIALLRHFTVVSLTNKGFGLRTNEGSSWAIFDLRGEPPQIKGPPVEYGEDEVAYVACLREWMGLLDDDAKDKLERANQKVIEAGRGKSKS
ncbi:hypothetical protein F5Y15DRAFT_373592 [Xylariaceae sp. FL0016]|nr:hypothetical protein F5Y15DRAFT_373592 [Xylariaceae sp. FL0016]